jgi:hypothetical protein
MYSLFYNLHYPLYQVGTGYSRVLSPRSCAQYKWHKININWIDGMCFQKRQFMYA